jgi:hypothetical protein
MVSAGRAATALELDLGANPLVEFNEDLVFGWEFEVNVAIQLHHVGLFDAGSDGFERQWKIKIWRLDVSDTPSSAEIGPDTINENGFSYVETVVQIGPLVHGPTLQPGRYAIAAGGLNFGDGDGPIAGDLMPTQAASITVHPALAFIQGRSGMNTGHDEDLVFPETVEPGLKYFGPNFQFDVVPEPSSSSLIAIAGALWAARRRALVRRHHGRSTQR